MIGGILSRRRLGRSNKVSVYLYNIIYIYVLTPMYTYIISYFNDLWLITAAVLTNVDDDDDDETRLCRDAVA